ncbi:hypothetical protein ATY41_06935 [Leifsonia xyli subsp. xyli]|uniref:Uncharacterized protein n=1 Tax=Leifsonia xyli subsp. xyli TaxID=59736 RepID=A0A1E2SMQ8_LEIXY|nr:hypothetical protein [Leifsonia xyli]ODA91116.1 hypothetical protein ATY41_06935 [Leifsonia xyli subsp. xyli]
MFRPFLRASGDGDVAGGAAATCFAILAWSAARVRSGEVTVSDLARNAAARSTTILDNVLVPWKKQPSRVGALQQGDAVVGCGIAGAHE